MNNVNIKCIKRDIHIKLNIVLKIQKQKMFLIAISKAKITRNIIRNNAIMIL